MEGKAPPGVGLARGLEDADPVPGFLGNRAVRAAAQSAQVPSTETCMQEIAADALIEGMCKDVGFRGPPTGKDSPYEDDDDICAAIRSVTGDAWSAITGDTFRPPS